MSITNGYTTLDTVKSGMNLTDNDDDLVIEAAIEAASRAIDATCNRRFFLDSTATARTYLLPYTYAPGVVMLRGKMWHDFDPATVPVIKSDDDGDGTFETTWTVGTDYQLEPLNHSEMEAEPQNTIRLIGSKYIHVAVWGQPQLQVTAKWGWPSVPSTIERATAILAVDYFRAKDAPFGIGGIADYGVFRVRQNQIVMGLIGDYRLPKGLA